MNKNYKKVMTMGMAMAMMGSTVAFATEETKTGAEASTTVDATLVVPATPIPVTAPIAEDEAVVETSDYILNTGKVSIVDKMEDGGVQITIDNEQGGLRFMVSPDTKIVNSEDGTYITADKLVVDMAVAVAYPSNSPMGMSMPGYLGSVSVVIANADKSNVVVAEFDENLTSEKEMLALNISEETVIKSINGTKEAMTAEDVKDANVVAFYGVTTRSIPAQTTPSLILVLNDIEVPEAPEVPEVPEEVVATLVELREEAKELDYKVVWQGKTAPVLVTGEDITIEIVIGDETYTVDGETKEAQIAPKLVDGVLMVSSDVLA